MRTGHECFFYMLRSCSCYLSSDSICVYMSIMEKDNFKNFICANDFYGTSVSTVV